MAGRHAKPVALHLAEGNPNRLTKEEIKQRQAAEVKLGDQDLKKLKKPSFITQDKIANKLWNDLIKEYKSATEQGVELLTRSDAGILALYCKTYSEYEKLLVQHQRLEAITINEHLIEALEIILKVEAAINKKMDMLLKLQDRLFLNPLAKVKNIPKKPEPKQQSAMAQFLNRRASNRA